MGKLRLYSVLFFIILIPCTSQAQWKSLYKGITFATAGTVIYNYDEDIRDFFQKNRSSLTDSISDIVRPFGDWRVAFNGMSLGFLYGYATENKKLQKVTALSAGSVVASGLITLTLKYSTHRHRPSSNDPYNTWDGPALNDKNLSFPSGHATVAFSVASVISSEYEDKSEVVILAYTIATLTALSRINDDEHWASDVFVGSAIGYITGKSIVKLEKKYNVAIFPLYKKNKAFLTFKINI